MPAQAVPRQVVRAWLSLERWALSPRGAGCTPTAPFGSTPSCSPSARAPRRPAPCAAHRRGGAGPTATGFFPLPAGHACFKPGWPHDPALPPVVGGGRLCLNKPCTQSRACRIADLRSAARCAGDGREGARGARAELTIGPSGLSARGGRGGACLGPRRLPRIPHSPGVRLPSVSGHFSPSSHPPSFQPPSPSLSFLPHTPFAPLSSYTTSTSQSYARCSPRPPSLLLSPRSPSRR